MIQCVVVTDSASSTGEEGAAQSSPMSARPAQCLRCAADLSKLPDEARYCPRCGLDAHASPPWVLTSEPSHEQLRLAEVLGGWQHLAELSNSSAPERPAIPAAEPPTGSTILQGYGNALYRLGTRYESAPSRNSREAMRCYCKAARLGNVLALARLASRWLWPIHFASGDNQGPHDLNQPHA